MKKHRRGRRRSKNVTCSENKCTLFHLNIRGFNSKRQALENIAQKLSPSIITLNETALSYKKKPKLNNYISFQRNRSEKSMGGVCTLVKSEFKDKFIKVTEGDNDDEFLITRHSNFVKPLNIINIYGEQESRCSKEEVEKRWDRIQAEICKIVRRNELILILGDLNKHIGNDELGKSGNHSKISAGGELLQGFLSNCKYTSLNNSSKAVEELFTRSIQAI